jgi:hypothetical protein
MKKIILSLTLTVSLMFVSFTAFAQCEAMANMYVSLIADTTYREFYQDVPPEGTQYVVDDLFYDDYDASYSVWFTISSTDSYGNYLEESFEAYILDDGSSIDVTNPSDSTFYLYLEAPDLLTYTFLSNNTDTTISVSIADISGNTEQYDIGPGQYLYYDCGDNGYALLNPLISVMNYTSGESNDVHLEKGEGYYFEWDYTYNKNALKKQDISDISIY